MPGGNKKVTHTYTNLQSLTNVRILYLLIIPEKPKVFWCFEGIQNGDIRKKQVKGKLMEIWKSPYVSVHIKKTLKILHS